MASGSSNSYRRRARSPTTGDMVERQRRRRFEQVLGGAALSLALPDPPAPVSRLMDFSRRPWNVFGGIEAARADDAAAGPPAPPPAPPAPSTPLPRWMATSPVFNGLDVQVTPAEPLARLFTPRANDFEAGSSRAPPPAPPAASTPLPRWMALATSPAFNSLLRPRGRSPVASCPVPTMPRRGTSARRHPCRTWIHYDRGKCAPSAASPRASLRHSANHAGSSSKT